MVTTDDTHHKTRAERQAELHHHDDPTRRSLSVGQVWIVGLVCLMIGALLNASGIRKTALSQPVGWRRDVAKFLANPLYDVSHALHLDEPRVALLDLIGREGEDKVDLTLPSPTARGGTGPTTTLPGGAGAPKVPKKKPKFTPTKPARLWVGGDSLSITPGESVINQAVATQVIGPVQPVDGHVATGLSRPEVLNWPAYLYQIITTKHPDVMVITIGSNDDQAVTGQNAAGPMGSPEWQKEYRRRVGGFMDAVTRNDIKLFWIGIPLMRNGERFETRYKIINEIFRSEAAKRPNKVFFIDTVPLLANPQGGYTDYLALPNGSLARVRAADGIHFERDGADIIARAVLAAMNAAFDLTSWKSDAPATTVSPSTTATTGKSPPRSGTTSTTYVPRSRG